MIKTEFLDLGPHNEIGEPDPAGGCWAFTVCDLGQPRDEPQKLTFYVPAHQLPTDHAQAEKQAAAQAEREAIAYEICEFEEHDAEQNDWSDGAWLAKRIASAIRARGNPDALEAAKAEARAEALREAAYRCNQFAKRDLTAAPKEYGDGYADGAGRCEDAILALIPETDGEDG